MPTHLTEAGGFTLDPRGTGKFLVKIIDVGEGSSAIYSAEALQAAARERVFPAGTHMYMDHADETRRGGFGERSIRDLASVLTTDASWDPAQQALVAEAQAVAGLGDTLESLAPHVGVSISAIAEVDAPPQPGQKPVVRRIVASESVDWVVRAGRGGAVLSILESAGIRPAAQVAEAATDDRRDQLVRALRALYPPRETDADMGAAWLHDFDDVVRRCWYRQGPQLWQQDYTVADDDQSVTLIDGRTEVRAVTTYLPVTDGVAQNITTQEGASMPEIPEARLSELLEAEKKAAALESERAAATARAEEAERKLAEAEQARKVTEARQQASARVAEATKGENPHLAGRVEQTVLAGLTEGEVPADLDARITKAVEAEKAYLASLTEGRLSGFGASTTTDTTPQRVTNAWGQPKGA